MGPADWANVIANGAQIVWQVVQTSYLWILMDNLTDKDWLWEQAKKFGIEIDKIIIKYADKVYNLFCDIVNGTLLTKEVVDGIMTRLYLLVGILVFFRIAITLIRYIVAPETFLDDKVGAAALVKKVVLGMITIVSIPLIFSMAGTLQKAILEDKIIERTILPNYAYNTLVNSKNTGNRLAMIAFEGFFNWNTAVPNNVNSTSKVYRNYQRVILRENIEALDNRDVTKKYNNKYMIDYIPILSTLVTGYVLYTLVKYTIEIALRSFKLAFLQIISPVIIINYMLNPASEDSMRKWTRMTISTYVLMFVRVLTLWFVALMAFYLKNGIPDAEGGATSLITANADPFVKSVIVVALFAFLKDLPKMLTELLGLDLQENETINGVLKQGVGVLKGMALGRVGQHFAKQQLQMNSVGSAIGGAGGIAGGIAGARKAEGFSGLKTSHKIGTLSNASFKGFGESWAPMIHDSGSAISSSMGSTVLGPIAHQGSLARASYNHGDSNYKSAHEQADSVADEDVKTKKKKDDTERTTPTSRGANAGNNNNNNNPLETLIPSEDSSSNEPMNMSGTIKIGNIVAQISESAPQLYNATTNSFNMSSDGANNQVIRAVTNTINEHVGGGNVTTEHVTQVFQQSAHDMSSVTPTEIVEVSQNIINSMNEAPTSSTASGDNIIQFSDYASYEGNNSSRPLRDELPSHTHDLDSARGSRTRNNVTPLRPPQEDQDNSRAA